MWVAVTAERALSSCCSLLPFPVPLPLSCLTCSAAFLPSLWTFLSSCLERVLFPHYSLGSSIHSLNVDLLIFFLVNISFYLFERVIWREEETKIHPHIGERGRGREGENHLLVHSPSSYNGWGLGKAETRNQVLLPDLLFMWKNLSTCIIFSCFLGTFSKELGQYMSRSHIG